MKVKYFFIGLFSLTLISSTCKKDLHKVIKVINKSGDDIVLATKFRDPDWKCILNGPLIKANGTFQLTRNFGWDGWLANGRTDTIYFVDPQKYNELQVFYGCDSIGIKNNILKVYEITLEKMKQNNWTIIYE